MPLTHTARGEEYLNQIADGSQIRIRADDVAVVVAHPDDETIGCGALLARCNRVRVLVVTDGAPRNLQDATAYGFPTAEAYAAARNRELREAMALAGIAESRISQLGVPDQQAAFRLHEIITSLTQLFEDWNIDIAITHAYEGGHPDHDAVAFAVHRAAAQARQSVSVIEVPLYRAEGEGDVRQSFTSAPRSPVVSVALTPDEQARKRRMFSAYLTQKNVLGGFSTEVEQFRPAPHYNFSDRPNNGNVLYDRESWGIKSADWLKCVQTALLQSQAAA